MFCETASGREIVKSSMLSHFGDFRMQANDVPGRSFPHQPKSPSVTSVTSVRCIPVSRDSRTQANGVPGKSFPHNPKSPLCDLRDLCAMHSSCARFSHPGQRSPRQKFPAPTPSPPSVTSVTSVRCIPLSRDSRTQANGVPGKSFPHTPSPPSVTSVTSVRCIPLSRDSRTQANGVPGKSFPHNPKSPLCDLRDLCAMHSRFARFSDPGQRCPLKSFTPSRL